MIHLVAALAVFAAPDTPSATGACAWSHLPETERRAVLAAYDQGMAQGMRALSQRDSELQSAVRTCVGRSDLPGRWTQGAIAAHVIQLGASARLEREKGLSRARLDEAWNTAGDAARNCALNNAAKPFAVVGPECPDRRAGAAFLEPLGLSRANRTDRAAVEQALVYMNAKAQQLIVDRLIAQAPTP